MRKWVLGGLTAAGLALGVTLAACGASRSAGVEVTFPSSTANGGAGGTRIARAATSAASSPRAAASRRPHRTPARAQMRTGGCGKPFPAGETVDELAAADGPRGYRVHVPPGYDPRRPASVVLNFHGYAQTAEQQEAYSGLIPISDANGFILVTPEGNGSPQGWAISGVYDDDGGDDVGFVSDLVAHLSDVLCVDPHRVYATGHSNGAEMASQVACFLPELIAAAAPVSGAVFQDCQGDGVPIIAFQGTDDWNVPFEDSASAIEQWISHNRCSGGPVVTSPAADVELDAWKCPGGDVSFYILQGVGHVWPGGDQSRGGVGTPTDAINASQLMWAFFRSHPKP